MKNRLVASFVLIAVMLVCQSWGFYGLKRINRMAALTLLPVIVGFYKKNIESVTAHAVDPDTRRYAPNG